jgi:hypothetical protein
LPDQKQMTLYVAVSYQAKDKNKPELGALTVKAIPTSRLPNVSSTFRVQDHRGELPDRSQRSGEDHRGRDHGVGASDQRVIALDRVLAMVDTSAVTPRNTEGVKADPPPIYFSEKPAVLINLDGPPIWSPIPHTDLRFAVNTNWDLFEYRNAYVLPARRQRVALRVVGKGTVAACRETTRQLQHAS